MKGQTFLSDLVCLRLPFSASFLALTQSMPYEGGEEIILIQLAHNETDEKSLQLYIYKNIYSVIGK